MKKNCKILTEDPILIKNQNMIAKFLIQKDRGMNVRNKKEYLFLLNNHFKTVNYKIVNQLLFPTLGLQQYVKNSN